MKILICTGIYPPDIGGPAKYAKNLAEEFLGRGHKVKVLTYQLENKLPIGIRHLFYFSKVIFSMRNADLIIALDMFSTGFPAVLAGKIFGKKTILRVGGDFLWETYVEKTGNLITLKDFYPVRSKTSEMSANLPLANRTSNGVYSQKPKLPLKHKIIAVLEKFTLQKAQALAFNTQWQKGFFEQVYGLDKTKTFVVENFYPEKNEGFMPKEKNFLFAGRRIKFKNLELLEKIFKELQAEGSAVILDIVDNLSQEKLQEKIKSSYALIVPSISDFAPNFIVEGLSFNKPFILTKECGLTDKLNDLGVFIDPSDKNSIREAILSLMDENNYNKYKKKIADFNFTHSWLEIADEILEIYKKMPASGGSAFGGKILMISTDRSIFDENSEAKRRMVEYGKLAEKLRIIVLSRPFRPFKIGKEMKGFDLVTAQDPFECGLIGYVAAKILGTPLQLQVHTDFLSKYFWRESLLNKIRVLIAKFLIPRAACIRVVSERIKSSLSAISYQLSAISVLPIFVDTEKIKNAPIKTDLRKKYPQFDFLILMASRLTKEKNISLAMEAMEEIVKKYPKTGLIIVGSGSEENKLKAEGSKLKANVIFEPWADDLASYYKTADLFLLTSNYEGYGRTLIEAAAAGCPPSSQARALRAGKIISSDVGIADEILERENIFAPGDKKGLEEKITKAIKNEIKPAKPVEIRTKEEYLSAYKKSWEQCGF